MPCTGDSGRSPARTRVWLNALLVSALVGSTVVPGPARSWIEMTSVTPRRMERLVRQQFHGGPYIVRGTVAGCEPIEIDGRATSRLTVSVSRGYKGAGPGEVIAVHAPWSCEVPEGTTSRGREAGTVGQEWLFFVRWKQVDGDDPIPFVETGLSGRIADGAYHGVTGYDLDALLGILASLEREHDPRAMAETADAVVIGTVRDLEVGFEWPRDEVMTLVDVEPLAGRPRPDDRLRASTVAPVSWERYGTFVHPPRLEPGTRVIVFLRVSDQSIWNLLPFVGPYAAWRIDDDGVARVLAGGRDGGGRVQATMPVEELRARVASARTH